MLFLFLTALLASTCVQAMSAERKLADCVCMALSVECDPTDSMRVAIPAHVPTFVYNSVHVKVPREDRVSHSRDFSVFRRRAASKCGAILLDIHADDCNAQLVVAYKENIAVAVSFSTLTFGSVMNSIDPVETALEHMRTGVDKTPRRAIAVRLPDFGNDGEALFALYNWNIPDDGIWKDTVVSRWTHHLNATGQSRPDFSE